MFKTDRDYLLLYLSQIFDKIAKAQYRTVDGAYSKAHPSLELGEEVAVKDIKALLNAEQQQQLADTLAAQVELKKNKRARTDEEKQALGWKSIREVRLDVLRSALKAANDGLLADYERRLREKEIRQADIYLREYSDARKADKSAFAAQGAANNALTRAALVMKG